MSKEVQEDFTKNKDFNNSKTKVDDILLSQYVLKSTYDSEIGNLNLRIPDISGLLQTSTFNSRITEIEVKIKTAEGKIPDISNLVNKTQLTTLENQIPDISNLVNKTE